MKQFETIQKSTEDEIIKAEKEMLEERNKLIEQQSVIAPEAFELKAKDYEKKLQNFQVEKQNKLRKLDGLIQKVNFDILENVNPILEDLSQEMGITVILEKSSVVLSATNMDITENVVKKLNKELPKIKVSLD
jgi:Skp family chaperone for outer membrane proteins